MYINSSLPWFTDSKKFNDMVNLCYRLGYQGAIIDLRSVKEYKSFINSSYFPKRSPEIVFPISIKNISIYKSEIIPIPLIPKITIVPKNQHALKKKLSMLKSKRCLISVESCDKKVLEIAARDGRVDLLSIQSENLQKSMTKGILSLSRQNRCALDLSFSQMIQLNRFKRTKILRTIYRLFLKAKPNSNLYLLGSGSQIKNDFYLIRGPKETIALLISIFKIPEMHAKKMLSENVEKMILRFIKRDQGLFIEPGVEIVDIVEDLDGNEKNVEGTK